MGIFLKNCGDFVKHNSGSTIFKKCFVIETKTRMASNTFCLIAVFFIRFLNAKSINCFGHGIKNFKYDRNDLTRLLEHEYFKLEKFDFITKCLQKETDIKTEFQLFKNRTCHLRRKGCIGGLACEAVLSHCMKKVNEIEEGIKMFEFYELTSNDIIENDLCQDSHFKEAYELFKQQVHVINPKNIVEQKILQRLGLEKIRQIDMTLKLWNLFKTKKADIIGKQFCMDQEFTENILLSFNDWVLDLTEENNEMETGIKLCKQMNCTKTEKDCKTVSIVFSILGACFLFVLLLLLAFFVKEKVLSSIECLV